MRRFQAKKEKRHISGILSTLLICLVLIFSWKGLDSLQTSTNAEQTQILEDALMRSITACYALEGAYPPDITYLVEHYGLVYDEEQYFIDYQYIGSNLRPDVTILKRNE